MNCRKLRKKYMKYAEVRALDRMRSGLQTAGKVEKPDTYWDTYWTRLEKKLPDKPLRLTLKSRILKAMSDMLRQPVFLGRVVIYILILAFLIYTTPSRIGRLTSKPLATALPPSSIEEAASSGTALAMREDARQSEENRLYEYADKRAFSEESDGEALGRPVDDATLKLGLRAPEIKAGLAETGGATAQTAAKSAAIPALKEQPGMKVSAGEDEYAAADLHFQNGEYPQAITAYQNFIESNLDDPRTLKAKYQIGESYYQLGDYSEALVNFIAVTEAEEPDKKSEVSQKVAAMPRLSSHEAEAKLNEKLSEEKRGTTAAGRAELSYDYIPETRELLISRAIFRQAESYEYLKKDDEALAKYREYVQKYPRGEYISQAKEKIAKFSQ